MMNGVKRETVDLSKYPDLVVIYLGMKMRTVRGLITMLGFGPKIQQSVASKPDGLLLHEDFIFSLFPPHGGMREYWRDFESLERWTRSEPHRIWWQKFLKDSGGTSFWHETYFMRGGMEAIYDHMDKPYGMMRFADVKPARGPMFGARARSGRTGEAPVAPLTEQDLY